jgi:phosphatidylglycerol---prolipoprotein diacylglyceryl transferase
VHPLLFHLGPILIPTYGVLVAIAVLVALSCASWSARHLQLESNAIWNLGVLAIFTSLVAARLFLVALNFHDLRKYPLWLLGLAMIPNSLVAIVGVAVGVTAAFLYARKARLPLLSLVDCLAPAIAIGYALERVGCFAAGSAYGSPTNVAWAVTYRSRLAALWSGTPLEVPVHPVQLYEAGAEFLLGLVLLWRLPKRAQPGELAGYYLFATGLIHFLCQLLRGDTRGFELFGGFLTITQLFAVLMVIAGGTLLRKRDTVISGPSRR